MTYEEIRTHLQSLANPEIAEHSKGFFKTADGEYGAGDKFLGIRVPIIRQAVKKFKNTSLETTQQLLHSEYHEIRMFALFMLVSHFAKADNELQKTIYQLYLDNTDYINNWDLVDGSSHQIIGGYLYSRDKSILYDLVKSSSLWERRISIMSTFYFIKKNHYVDTIEIAELLLHDQEDLIHKATGWMLREVGKRDLNTELVFLNKHYKVMPRTMLRYAIEKFDDQLRQRYLSGQI